MRVLERQGERLILEKKTKLGKGSERNILQSWAIGDLACRSMDTLCTYRSLCSLLDQRLFDRVAFALPFLPVSRMSFEEDDCIVSMSSFGKGKDCSLRLRISVGERRMAAKIG
jgi:hypothetical protein